MYLLSSVLLSLSRFVKLDLWAVNLVLKVLAVSPMCILSQSVVETYAS